MIFTLEALDAKHGDALLLHFGDAARPGLVLIDGGPAGVYRRRLAPRLVALQASAARDAGAPADAPLVVDLAMVSHIDDDHINGLLALLRDLDEKDSGADTPRVEIRGLWHNSFSGLTGHLSGGSAAEVSGAAEAADSAGHPPPFGGVGGRTHAVVASIPQGNKLRGYATRLGIPINPKFGDLVLGPSPGSSVTLGELALQVIGPSRARLDALAEEWQSWLRDHGAAPDTASAAAYLDESVFNLSSIVVLAECGGRSMLLTGDARGDHILEGLQAAGRLMDGVCRVDLLKTPHHGSSRNVTTEFFRAVTADHYVISADGRHHNPDREMLEMLFDARGDGRFTLHLTNRVPEVWEFATGAAERMGFELVARDEAHPSVSVHLGEEQLDR